MYRHSRERQDFNNKLKICNVRMPIARRATVVPRLSKAYLDSMRNVGATGTTIAAGITGANGTTTGAGTTGANGTTTGAGTAAAGTSPCTAAGTSPCGAAC
nr:hypothetical protein Iba_chr07eCG0790 [Ipomoea batatas]